MRIEGNDHVIEYNELVSLCLDTGDVGGIYTGRDWAARGTQLRFNHIHHLGGLNMGSNAIYLDDLASGQTIHGNIIHDVWRAMMIGGGAALSAFAGTVLTEGSGAAPLMWMMLITSILSVVAILMVIRSRRRI